MQTTTWDQRRETLGGSLWFLPLLTTMAALLLGFVLGLFHGTPEGPLGTVVFHGGPEEARRVLITVATATIGVFAMVVGLTLVALQVAQSRYSPRLVRSILRDRPTQFVLSLFIATFAYNAAGLYTISGTRTDEEYPRLAVTVGIVLLFICIAALVYYVDRIAHTIQLHSLLRHITGGARRAVARRPAGIGREAGLRAKPRPTAAAVRLVASRSGYVQRLRTEAIVQAAASEGVVVELTAGIGEQVVDQSTLGWVWRANSDAAPVVSPALRSVIDRAVTVGTGRSTYSDVALSAIEMIDIALLSLHIYDHHTVEQSTAELTMMMTRLATLPLGDETFTSGDGIVRLVVPGRDFEDYLELACGEIRRRGASEPVVLLSLIRMLRSVGTVAEGTRLDAVYTQLKLIRKSAKNGITLPHDLDLVRKGLDEALEAIAQASGNRLSTTEIDLDEPEPEPPAPVARPTVSRPAPDELPPIQIPRISEWLKPRRSRVPVGRR